MRSDRPEQDPEQIQLLVGLNVMKFAALVGEVLLQQHSAKNSTPRFPFPKLCGT